ncbi:MAG: PP2C family protein-serine/threonine phosphatase, partial [Cyanobacteria bacterium P01_H01_bin.15]
PAGLIMTMTRGMLRAEVLNRHRPAHILRHLNRVMYADLDNSSRFVTLFYSEYNPQTRELAFANAAHNPPMLWQATTQTIVPLDTDGMLMGFAREGDFEDARIQLSSGDALMYYTDGFTEAVNASGERFEVENLQQAFIRACQQDLKAQQTLDYLFAEVDRFVGADQSGNDDMTLVVMKVTT